MISLVPYESNRVILRAMRIAGHKVAVRRNRNGSVRIRIDEHTETDVLHGMNRCERWYLALPRDEATRLIEAARAELVCG